jgi:hypothetical protein
MAEFQWWLLLVGLVAGGGLVAVVTMDGRRREEDLVGIERRAEATWIAERLTADAGFVEAETVEDVLRLHREYLGMPPPDEIVVEGDDAGAALDELETEDADREALDGDPDEVADDVGDDRGRAADEDLPRA